MHLRALFYYKKLTLSTILEHSFLFIYFMLLFTPNSVTSNDYSSFKNVKALKYVSAYNLILTGAFSDIKLFVNKINPFLVILPHFIFPCTYGHCHPSAALRCPEGF